MNSQTIEIVTPREGDRAVLVFVVNENASVDAAQVIATIVPTSSAELASEKMLPETKRHLLMLRDTLRMTCEANGIDFERDHPADYLEAQGDGK